MAPFLTKVSQEYCAEEYLRDTDDFIEHIGRWNDETSSTQRRERLHLFTLDVKALYPSIRPELAKLALIEALSESRSLSPNTKDAVIRLTNLVLDNSYITCKGKCYLLKEGMPTGGCNSRQQADNFLHWLFRMVKDEVPGWEHIKTLKRFIDDIFGLWRGTERQFNKFVETLNAVTRQYGIEFGDHSFGDSVDFLDVTIYLDENGLIQYKLYLSLIHI